MQLKINNDQLAHVGEHEQRCGQPECEHAELVTFPFDTDTYEATRKNVEKGMEVGVGHVGQHHPPIQTKHRPESSPSELAHQHICLMLLNTWWVL